MSENLMHRIALSLLPGVGPVLAKSLLAYCGSAEAVFKEKKAMLEKVPGLGPVTAKLIVGHSIFDRAEAEVERMQKLDITPLFYTDENYPQRLRNCVDSPVMLYFKGKADLNTKRVLAIVGTRKSTEYGTTICEKLIHDLKEAGVMIISGLAYGIDVCAHKAALASQMPTVAVMAHGLDKMYPAVHGGLAKKMIGNGGLLSEYITGTIADKENFPSRNRIVAGMCDAVLIVESGIHGGSLITANIAHSYNRDVFAIPGKAGDEYSAGCNHFIKINKAGLVESAADILYQMGWEAEKVLVKDKSPQKKLFPDLKEDEKIIFDYLETQGRSELDILCHELHITISKASALLLSMEFAGHVRSLPGKVYELA